MEKQVLQILRRGYQIFFPKKSKDFFTKKKPDLSKEKATAAIISLLKSEKPCMIGRFGKVELDTIAWFKYSKIEIYHKFIVGKIDSLEFPENYKYRLENNAGFFPATRENIAHFVQLYIADSKKLDILGSWLDNEKVLKKELVHCTTVHLEDLNAFSHPNPWTKALEGKKVLVIHPFVDSIHDQFKNREKLFSNPNVLPNFHLITYKPIESLAGNSKTCGFASWFEALDKMKNDIKTIHFDIAILGCGAYGFPLAAYIKGLGKKSVHIGGATQLLFGIIGKRWEEEYNLSNVINEYWKRPYESEKPQNFTQVENGCYW